LPDQYAVEDSFNGMNATVSPEALPEGMLQLLTDGVIVANQKGQAGGLVQTRPGKQTQPISNPMPFTMKNGTSAMKGVCPNCGTPMVKITAGAMPQAPTAPSPAQVAPTIARRPNGFGMSAMAAKSDRPNNWPKKVI
jgi:hypothetical protein